MMQVTIRETIAEDAVPIFELRLDRRLRGMQYAPSSRETPATSFAALQPGPEIPQLGWKSATILVDNTFAGNISQFYSTDMRGVTTALLGWNLRPELWGNGIMVRALSLLFDSRFESQRTIQFEACCFASNQRCIRVIQKLGFRDTRLYLVERIFHFCKTWGSQRILKFQLTHDMWIRSQSQSPLHAIGAEPIRNGRLPVSVIRVAKD